MCGVCRLSRTPLLCSTTDPIQSPSTYRNSPPRLMVVGIFIRRQTRVRPGRSGPPSGIGIRSRPPQTARCVRLRRGSKHGVSPRIHVCLPCREVVAMCGVRCLSLTPLLARRPTPTTLQKLAAVLNGGFIHTSTNSGETWTARMTDTNRFWRSIASSSDGTVRQVGTR